MGEAHTDPTDYKHLHRIEGQRHARALNFSCFHNQAFLRSPRTREWFVTAVATALETHRVHLWAYVVMPTHAHLLVFPTRNDTLMSDFVSSIKQSVAKRAVPWVQANAPAFLPRMLDAQPNGRRSYRFWQRGGGFDRNLWSGKAIWDMIDYIHLNPVNERLCRYDYEWEWSSARWYGDRTPGALAIDIRYQPGDPRRS